MSNVDLARKSGGSAFPSHGSMGEVVNEGMTLRDYFAAKAMIPCYQEWLKNGWNVPEHEEVMENIANESYLIADAMIKARQK